MGHIMQKQVLSSIRIHIRYLYYRPIHCGQKNGQKWIFEGGYGDGKNNEKLGLTLFIIFFSCMPPNKFFFRFAPRPSQMINGRLLKTSFCVVQWLKWVPEWGLG